MLFDDLRNSAVASLAVPDTDGVTLDSGLAAEGAGVLGVLGDFHLLDGLSERGTVSLSIHVSSCLMQGSYSPRSCCAVVAVHGQRHHRSRIVGAKQSRIASHRPLKYSSPRRAR